MSRMSAREKLVLEIILILVSAGIACLLWTMQGYKLVILNLFFLPVALSAFFLGRYHGGVLALFCGISATLVMALELPSLTTAASPLVIALAVTAWGAVLGLMALVIGALSDEWRTKLNELHEAYVGVVEVLSQYLQSAHPRLKARSIRVAELSQAVAEAMKLSLREIDDIRVAALLYDIGNIEVTTKVIRRAVGMFHDDGSQMHQSTFQGMDLMLSLGSILSGAVPLLLNQDQNLSEAGDAKPCGASAYAPLGAKIIRLVRDYLTLAEAGPAGQTLAPAEIFQRLRSDRAAQYDAEAIRVLQSALSQPQRSPPSPVEDAAAEPMEACGAAP